MRHRRQQSVITQWVIINTELGAVAVKDRGFAIGSSVSPYDTIRKEALFLWRNLDVWRFRYRCLRKVQAAKHLTLFDSKRQVKPEFG